MRIIHTTAPRFEDDDFLRHRIGRFYPSERFTKDGRLKPPTPSRPAPSRQARSTTTGTGIVMTPGPAPVDAFMLEMWRRRLVQAGAFAPTPRPTPKPPAATQPEADAARMTPPVRRAGRPVLLGA